ncbi:MULTISPECIES: YncE family protein [unclassified Nocardia]|uniref:YncE family protein n=1 Tax=unclassified Nocardia TaxID=2637762 RepID=UPI00278C1163|nr:MULTISPECIES: hypothetical protein [unclassified Nocardia]
MGYDQSVWLRVDFGVTETSAELLGVDCESRPLRLADGAAAMPSGVFLSPTEGLEVGVLARKRGGDEPERYAGEPRRLIDAGLSVVELGGTAVPVHVVVAAVLRAVVARAQAESGWQLPAGLMLTHPQQWTAAQTQVLVAAAGEVGYPPERLRLLPEMPDAAPNLEKEVTGAATSVSESDYRIPASQPSPALSVPVHHASTQHTPGFSTSPPPTAPTEGRLSRLALLVVAALVVLAGAVATGVAVVRSSDSSAEAFNAGHGTIAVGASQGVGYTVVDPVNHRLYTVDSQDETVSVVDTVAQETVATVPVGASTRGLAIDPEHRVLWVLADGSQDGKTLMKIDTATNTVVGTATVPVNAADIAVNTTTHEVYTGQPNGEVVDQATGASVVASIVDPTTMEVTGRIVTPGHGANLAVNPEDGRVYLNGLGRVTVIDPITRSVVGRIDYPGMAYDIVVDPQTKTAFLAGGSGIVVLDLTTGNYDRTIEVGHRVAWLAIDPTVGNVYAPESGALDDISLTVIDTATRTVKGVIEMDSAAEGVAADTVSHQVYVRPMRSYVTVIDPCAALGCD